MGKVYVIGVGVTKFTKPGARSDDYPTLVKEAVQAALGDAKIQYGQVEMAFVSYNIGDTGYGQRALQHLGLTGIPIFNIANMCSGGSSALYLAKEFIEMDRRDCVLVTGFELMKRGSFWLKYNDRTAPAGNHFNVLAKVASFDEKTPHTPQVFGSAGIEYMRKYGTTEEQLAKIAYKNHKHAASNPNAQFQIEYSVEEILNSPRIFGPLTRLQCSAPGDGAAAAILASERFVIQHGLQNQAIEILGMEMITDVATNFKCDAGLFPMVGFDITKEATDRLFSKANRNRSDVQVIEMHDSFSTFEIIMYEALGLCEPGKGNELVDNDDNTYGGKYVINPSGGLISRGHPFGATGIAQCYELCLQLRGEAGKRQVQGAKLALQHNVGLGTAVVVTLYQKANLN